jgi:acyl-coenzyme A thioesterase PaaI-like protein
MGVTYHLLDDGSVTAAVEIGGGQEGPPGYAHGGAMAAILDEAMGAAAWFNGTPGLSVHLEFDYQRPVPLGASVRVTGRVERCEGRKVFTSGAVLLADGAVAVSARGIFVGAPQLLPDVTGFRLSSTLDE